MESRIERPAAGKKVAPATPVRVLLIGNDETLLKHRVTILTKAGYLVDATGPKTAAALVSGNAYKVAIFCHTLLPEEVFTLADHFRKTSGKTKLLSQVGLHPLQFHGWLFDDTVEGVKGPAALVEAVRKLAN